MNPATFTGEPRPKPRLASDLELENKHLEARVAELEAEVIRLRRLIIEGTTALGLGEIAQARWLDATAREFGVCQG